MTTTSPADKTTAAGGGKKKPKAKKKATKRKRKKPSSSKTVKSGQQYRVGAPNFLTWHVSFPVNIYMKHVFTQDAVWGTEGRFYILRN